jgi:uncharacterized damage-inducible protein DinB
MRMIDPLIMEFDRECSTTRKLLERLPDGKLDWAPHAKSMTLGKLAHHLATIPHLVGMSLLLDGFDAGAGGERPAVPSRAPGFVELFNKSVASAKAAMVQLDDARATQSWTLSDKGKTLLSMPRIAFVRMILLSHSIHHRGQLSVYLRLLDVPVPSIYGPSADENPFA